MTTSLVMFLSLATAAATMIGGLLAIGLQGRLPLVLGFSAGAVLGVAFFDLLPEAFAVGKGFQDARALMGFAALGFFFYAVLDRLAAQHGREGVPAPARGVIGAASFSVHSLLDGLMMGIAFRTGREIGLVVAAAVLAHDFSDGLNTVNIVVKNGGARGRALRWLILDAIAPVIGAGLSLLIAPPRSFTGPLLALFGGFFLYIGAADLLPASLRARPRPGTIVAIFMGAGVLWMATKLA